MIFSKIRNLFKSDENKNKSNILFLLKKFKEDRHKINKFYKVYSKIEAKDISNIKKKYSNEEYLEILEMLTMDYNGYLREKALSELIKERYKKLDIIVFRFGYNISKIKLMMKIYLFHFLEKDIDITEILKILENINNFFTDKNEEYRRVRDYLIVKNLDFIKKEFYNLSLNKQKNLVKFIFGKYKVIDDKMLSFLLKKDVLFIKLFLINNISKIENKEKVFEKSLNSKSKWGRLKALYYLKEKGELTNDILSKFIFDKSISIQDFVMFELSEDKKYFLNIYKKSLEKGQNIYASILGIGRTGNLEDIEILKNYLNSENIAIEKVALYSILSLKPKGDKEYIIKFLNSKYPKIRLLVIKYFQENRDFKYYSQIENIFLKGDVDVKKSLIKLSLKLGEYKFFLLFLENIILTKNKDLVLNLNFLEGWLRFEKTNYLQLSLENKVKIKEIYNKILNKRGVRYEKIKILLNKIAFYGNYFNK